MDLEQLLAKSKAEHEAERLRHIEELDLEREKVL